jgi:two-component system, NtrC family, sensor kinase
MNGDSPSKDRATRSPAPGEPGAPAKEAAGTPLQLPPAPTAERLLEGVLTVARELHLEMDEEALVGLFLGALAELFGGRRLAVRVLDPRSSERARCYVLGGELRAGVEAERITLKRTSVAKTRLKSAVAQSARIRVGDRWDSPFVGVAAGFAVPLVASGELYGVLDVGYPLGADLSAGDEPLVLPIANHLSVALRNQRLHRDTSLLRDYQAKLIEHANALILGVDRRWRITVCNQALCLLLGYDRAEIIGRDLRDWLPGEERPRLTKLFRQALAGAGGRQDTVDVALVPRGGGSVRTVWSVAAIAGHGQVEAVVAVGQDQTKLRELQEQVIQAEKLATLGQLAAGVVHELNNPLTSITVYAHYLLEKAERAPAVPDGAVGSDPGDVEKLRRISDGAQRILEFARDLVQYAKPAGSAPEPVAINHVVKHSLSFCEHLFDRAGVELTESLAPDLPPLEAVPGQLEQVVINLVTNAVHAVGEVAARKVMVHTFVAEPDMVGVSVSDTGPGIGPEDRERIFEPFFTTKSDGQGTGLGLSIVRNIVEQHSGSIRVDEAPGGGARFTILLPMR